MRGPARRRARWHRCAGGHCPPNAANVVGVKAREHFARLWWRCNADRQGGRV